MGASGGPPSTNGSSLRSKSFASVWEDCRALSRPRTSGGRSGFKRRTTRRLSRATRSSCERLKLFSVRGVRSATSSSGTTWLRPFLDGNGRTGRLLTNLVLVRLGYPPAIIYQRDRERYLSALQRADTGDIGPLGELFARAILDNLMQFVVPSVAGPVRLVPLEALSSPDLSVPALRAAASRGRLRAVRLPNGSWRSSRQWVEAYLAGRWSRSPQGDVDS